MYPTTNDIKQIIFTLAIGQSMWYRAIPLQNNGHHLIRTGIDTIVDHEIDDLDYNDYYQFSIQGIVMRTLFEYDIEENCPVCELYGIQPMRLNNGKVETVKHCDHEYAWYNGLVDNYEYCKLCDKRRD